MTWWYLSSRRMTVAVAADAGGTTRVTPPIVRKFRGQPLLRLEDWMLRQGGFRVERLDG